MIGGMRSTADTVVEQMTIHGSWTTEVTIVVTYFDTVMKVEADRELVGPVTRHGKVLRLRNWISAST